MDEPKPPTEIPGWFANALQMAKDMLPVDWVPYVEQSEQFAQSHPFLGGMIVGAVSAILLLQASTIIRYVIIGAAILAVGAMLLGDF